MTYNTCPTMHLRGVCDFIHCLTKTISNSFRCKCSLSLSIARSRHRGMWVSHQWLGNSGVYLGTMVSPTINSWLVTVSLIMPEKVATNKISNPEQNCMSKQYKWGKSWMCRRFFFRARLGTVSLGVNVPSSIQYTHLIPAPVDRTSASPRLFKTHG